jgi:hypothetical protein
LANHDAPYPDTTAYPDQYDGEWDGEWTGPDHYQGTWQGTYHADQRDGWIAECSARYRAYANGSGIEGALIGGAIGGFAGNRIAGEGNRVVGTVAGAAVGAVAGAAIDNAIERDEASDYCRDYYDRYTAGYAHGQGGYAHGYPAYGYGYTVAWVPVMVRGKCHDHGSGDRVIEEEIVEEWVEEPAYRPAPAKRVYTKTAPAKVQPIKGKTPRYAK